MSSLNLMHTVPIPPAYQSPVAVFLWDNFSPGTSLDLVVVPYSSPFTVVEVSVDLQSGTWSPLSKLHLPKSQFSHTPKWQYILTDSQDLAETLTLASADYAVTMSFTSMGLGLEAITYIPPGEYNTTSLIGLTLQPFGYGTGEFYIGRRGKETFDPGDLHQVKPGKQYFQGSSAKSVLVNASFITSYVETAPQTFFVVPLAGDDCLTWAQQHNRGVLYSWCLEAKFLHNLTADSSFETDELFGSAFAITSPQAAEQYALMCSAVPSSNESADRQQNHALTRTNCTNCYSLRRYNFQSMTNDASLHMIEGTLPVLGVEVGAWGAEGGNAVFGNFDNTGVNQLTLWNYS